MNKEKLSIGNVIWYRDCAWVVDSITSMGVYAHKFVSADDFTFIKLEDIQGIQITITSVEAYLGIKMERDETDTTMPEEQDWYDAETHRFRLSSVWWKTNRGGDVPAWFCHVDNNSYDSIGTADILYINELQNFLNSIDYKI